MPDSALVIRLLGLAGAAGGLLWTVVMLGAGLTFLGIDFGLLGFGSLVALGRLFRFVGAAIPLMFAGVVGVHLFARSVYGEVGRIGASLTGLGFVMLLPGSVIPSGSLPGISQYIPFVFFAGLVVIAMGSGVVGMVAMRSDALPPAIASFHGLSMPGGAIVGGVVALAGAGNIAFVLGFSVPYGLSWIALGGYLAIGPSVGGARVRNR